MTPQEKEMLQGLTDRINQTKLTEKDPEAEKFLFQALGRNSDSLYILAQTVLVQQYALDQAKQKLDQTTQQLDQATQENDQLRQQSQQQPPQKHGSFLGNLLGMNDAPAPPPPPQQYGNQSQYQPVQNYPPPPPQYGQPQYQPGYGQPQYGQGGYAQPPYGGTPQSGGFLRSALTTAAGVAAGAVAFEGIEDLMHGFGHSGGSEGFGGGGFGGQGRPEEVINNNYYGDSNGGDTIGHRADEAQGISPDLEDRRNDFANTGDDSQPDDSNDSSNFDDSNDLSSDDGSDFSSDDNNS